MNAAASTGSLELATMGKMPPLPRLEGPGCPGHVPKAEGVFVGPDKQSTQMLHLSFCLLELVWFGCRLRLLLHVHNCLEMLQYREHCQVETGLELPPKSSIYPAHLVGQEPMCTKPA